MAGTGLRPWGYKCEPKRPGSPSWGARGRTCCHEGTTDLGREGQRHLPVLRSWLRLWDMVNRHGYLLLNYSNIYKGAVKVTVLRVHCTQVGFLTLTDHWMLTKTEAGAIRLLMPHLQRTRGRSPAVSTFQFYPGVKLLTLHPKEPSSLLTLPGSPP